MWKRLVGLVSELMEAQRRVESGEADYARVSAGDAGFLMRRRADGSIRYANHDAEASVSGTAWPPSPSRPPAYPVDLPFLSDERTSIIELPEKGRRLVSWLETDAPGEMERAVSRELHELGWERFGARGVAFGLLGREVEFRRETSRCKLTVHRNVGRGAKVMLTIDQRETARHS